MHLPVEVRNWLIRTTCGRARRKLKHAIASALGDDLHHTFAKSNGLDLLHDDLFDPFASGLRALGGEDEASLCVIPVFGAILPESCIVSLVVVFAELLVSDLTIEQLVVFVLTFSIVSDCHSMSSDDLCLLSRLFDLLKWQTTETAMAACALRPHT